MVAAGVYLVARVFRLMTPDALMFVSTIGCLTLFLMALIAIVQTDIKKCLAYSTLSQLGYMIFGMGCGAWVAALFHLITHAFFKAMLFLGSGQVIEGCHHEQDMRRMGGLRSKMPVTCWTFFVGVLAIAGAGIPGLALGDPHHPLKVGLGGFFSKDEIHAVAYTRAFEWEFDKQRMDGEHAPPGEHAATNRPRVIPASDRQQHGAGHDAAGSRGPTLDISRQGEQPAARDNAKIFTGIPVLPKWMFYLALFTAYVTPFYMMRCWWMTFMGEPRDEHVYHHAHESPLMFIPLMVLACGTVLSSYFLFRPLIADAAGAATQAPLVLAVDGEVHTPAIGAAHHFLTTGVGFAFVAGFLAAMFVYWKGLAKAEGIKRALAPLHTLLVHKYYFDEVYDFVLVKGCVLLARIARFIDTWIVDLVFNLAAAATERFAAFSGLVLDNQGVDGIVNGISKTSMDVSDVLRAPQTGRIRNYVLIAAGVATAVLLVILTFFAQKAAAGVVVVGAGMGG